MATSSEGSFVQAAIPKFDGYYDHWAMLMENFLRSKEYWSLVEEGIPAAGAEASLTEAERKVMSDLKLRDLKVKNYLFQAIDRSILETILDKGTSKSIWESMKQKYQGTTRVKRAQLQALRKEFETLQMRDGEKVEEYFSRTLAIASKMKAHGDQKMDQVTIIEKILRSMTSRFDYVVCSVEESNDLDKLTIDELQSSLLVHEQRMKSHKVADEQALKVTYEPVRGRGRGGRGATHGRGRGRGRQFFDKALIECYKCHKLGHFQYECPSWEKVNYAEHEEEQEMLLMTHVEMSKPEDNIWFLDSGCSNHMTGNRHWFFTFDDAFRQNVKLGNDSTLAVMGKGNVRLHINGMTQVVSEVFYVPELKNNLLSLGQLQEKSLTILIQHGVCKVYHPDQGLIMQTKMSLNRMFILQASMNVQAQNSTCLQITSDFQTDLWHRRFGHLNFKGLQTLSNKEMVRGLPSLEASTKICTVCMVGKQHRAPIPRKSSWRASQILQLIHADVCGPITPESNSYKRQLTAAYTPQQNGVAERKNRTIMNMVRCMLSEQEVPKKFWPEAVNWAAHLLNRCPTLAVKNKTPEEAWSGFKPQVSHFRIFGCIGHVHIPDIKRQKLDDKSQKCVFLGISDESKAYRMYDPVSGKVITSRDVIFEEDKKWDWNKASQVNHNDVLTWEDENGHLEESEEDSDDEDRDSELSSNASDSPIPDQSSSASDSPSPVQGRIRRAPNWMQDYVMMVAANGKTDPTTFEEASKDPHWRTAMDEELQAIERNETWELTSLPIGAKSLGVKWIFKTKLNEKGEISKHKARLVVKGYAQQHGIDYTEVFAPVARWDTIRMVLAVAAHRGWSVFQLDVKSAFLHGDLQEAVFIEQPPGYEVKGEETKVYKLKKALYGLKQAPRAWYSKLESYFTREGFERCSHEYTLFTKQEDGGLLIISVYVDDLIFTGNNEEMIEAFKQSMKQEFAMSDLGKMKYFLGVEVIQNSQGIFIHQMKYALDILEKFNMEHSNPTKNPIVPGHKLGKDEGGVRVDATTYKQMIGSLMYLLATRPDLAFVMSLVSRFMENPTVLHQQAVKRVLRYVKGTADLGIWYKRNSEGTLVAFSDSDYAGDIEDRKSTSGYAFLLSSGAVAWSSKKQPVVTLSTTEAEFIAVASCACQGVWMRRILEELGQEQNKPLTVFCDNCSTIKLSKNPVMHGKSKHIDVRFHFLRDLSNDGVVKLEYCGSSDQVADIMTKPLPMEAFMKLRSMLGICSVTEIN